MPSPPQPPSRTPAAVKRATAKWVSTPSLAEPATTTRPRGTTAIASAKSSPRPPSSKAAVAQPSPLQAVSGVPSALRTATKKSLPMSPPTSTPTAPAI